MKAQTDVRAPSFAQLDHYRSARRSPSAGYCCPYSARKRRRANTSRRNHWQEAVAGLSPLIGLLSLFSVSGAFGPPLWPVDSPIYFTD